MAYTLITNAHILDPSCGRDEFGELVIRDTKIVPALDGEQNVQVIDAKGNLVIPGLIDFHTHIAFGLGDAGIHADLMTLPNGITAAVDAGSTGTAAFEGFVRHVIPANETTIKAFMNVTPIGVTTERHNEVPDPKYYDLDRIREMYEKYYPQYMLGLKLRMGRGFTTGFGIRPLAETKKIAAELGCPVCVHLTDSEVPYEQVLSLLDAGEILCHVYQGKGDYTILDQQKHVLDAAKRARERGVIFDMAAGRINYNLEVLRCALRNGFPPDIISTDAVATSVYQHMTTSIRLRIYLNISTSENGEN